MRATSASVPAHGDSVPLPHAGRSPRLRAIAAPLIALVLLLAVPAAASAASLLDTTVSATGTVERACFTRDLSSAAGVDAHTVRAPGVSVVQARLDGHPGDDWDVAILDAESGAVVAASAYRGSGELAEGFALGEERFLVQACRRSGDGDARLTVDTLRSTRARTSSRPS